MIKFLCLLISIAVCYGAVNQGRNQGRSVRLNPYTMKYIQQMMSRGYKPPQKLTNNYRPRNSQPPKISLQPMKSSKLTIQPLGVKPLLVKPVYGKTYLNMGSKGSNNKNQGNSGKYTFAQVQAKPNSNGKKVNPIMVALPNLGNLLYKYAKKQVKSRQTPVYNQNLYQMFGRQTYGPMPVPTGSSYTSNQAQQQQQQQQNSIYHQQQRSAYQHQPSPQPAPVPAPQPTVYSAPSSGSQGYNNHVAMASDKSGYQQPNIVVNVPSPAAKQMMYSSMPGQGNIHIGGYGDPGSDWGGMLYISGPAEEIVNVMQPNVVSSSGMSNYNPTVSQTGYGHPQRTQAIVQTNSGYGQAATKKSSGYIGAGTTCTPVPTNFCLQKKPGHFTSPGSRHCFIQCDAFGRGYNKECAPGTTWNVRGPEPALYNMCS